MPRGTTPFVRKTWDMLADKQLESIVCWTRNGNSFAILEATSFSEDVLPKFFKHGNLCSFIRQLNTYGFKKVTSRDSQEYEFSHKLFHRDHEELLAHITRRTANSKASEDSETPPLQHEELLCQLVENNKELTRRLKQLEEQHRRADDEMSKVRKELEDTKQYAQHLFQSHGVVQRSPQYHQFPPSQQGAVRIPEQRQPTPPAVMVTPPLEDLGWPAIGLGISPRSGGDSKSAWVSSNGNDVPPFHVDLPDSFWNAI